MKKFGDPVHPMGNFFASIFLFSYHSKLLGIHLILTRLRPSLVVDHPIVVESDHSFVPTVWLFFPRFLSHSIQDIFRSEKFSLLKDAILCIIKEAKIKIFLGSMEAHEARGIEIQIYYHPQRYHGIVEFDLEGDK